MDDDEHTIDEDPHDATPPASPLDRARGLFDRTAPMLRNVNEAIEQNPNLRDKRDAIADRASELVQRADDALGRLTAIEGTVIDDESRPATAPPASTAAPHTEHGSVETPPAPREPHWTKQRVARVMVAATAEAVRPHSRTVSPQTKIRVGAAALGALLVAMMIRRGRRSINRRW